MADIDISQKVVNVDVKKSKVDINLAKKNVAVDVKKSKVDVNIKRKKVDVEIQGAVVIQSNPKFIEMGVTAGEPISALRCITIIDGKAYVARGDNTGNQNIILGITSISAIEGDEIRYVTNGYLKNNAFSFDTTKPVFLANDGKLTQVKPNTGLVQAVGQAISSTEIIVNINSSIKQQ